MYKDPLYPRELLNPEGNIEDKQAMRLFSGVAELEGNPVATYMARVAPMTRRNLVSDLRTVVRLLTGRPGNPVKFPWWKLNYAQLLGLRNHLLENYKWQTANSIIHHVRGVLKESWRLNLMDYGHYARVTSVPNVKGARTFRGRYVRAHELEPVFLACAADTRTHGVRDAAIIAVFYCTGLRLQEVERLNLGDYQPDTGQITVLEDKLHFRRETFVTNESKAALDAWLELRGDLPGALFLAIQRKGLILNTRLHGPGLYGVVRKRAREGGLGKLATHDLRRSFITSMLESGVDLITTSRLAGHAHLSTTAMYDYRGLYTIRDACEQIHIPYRSPAAFAAAPETAAHFRFRYLQEVELGRHDWNVLDGLISNGVMALSKTWIKNPLPGEHPPGLVRRPQSKELRADKMLRSRFNDRYKGLWLSVKKLAHYGLLRYRDPLPVNNRRPDYAPFELTPLGRTVHRVAIANELRRPKSSLFRIIPQIEAAMADVE